MMLPKSTDDGPVSSRLRSATKRQGDLNSDIDFKIYHKLLPGTFLAWPDDDWEESKDKQSSGQAKQERTPILCHDSRETETGMVYGAKNPNRLRKHEQREWCLELKRGLYGCKQSGLLWWATVKELLCELGFTQSQQCQCTLWRGDFVLAIYVDDILAAAAVRDPQDWKEFAEACNERFPCKDLGKPDRVLNGKVTYHDDGSIVWSHGTIARRLVETVRALKREIHPKGTPLLAGSRDMDDVEVPDRQVDWDIYNFRKRLGGMALYLAGASRPDIATAVSQIAQMYEAPAKADVVRRIVQLASYIEKNPDRGVRFPGIE
jgi:hypothetical protein